MKSLDVRNLGWDIYHNNFFFLHYFSFGIKSIKFQYQLYVARQWALLDYLSILCMWNSSTLLALESGCTLWRCWGCCSVGMAEDWLLVSSLQGQVILQSKWATQKGMNKKEIAYVLLIITLDCSHLRFGAWLHSLSLEV